VDESCYVVDKGDWSSYYEKNKMGEKKINQKEEQKKDPVAEG
jgi:hypothetical protein